MPRAASRRGRAVDGGSSAPPPDGRAAPRGTPAQDARSAGERSGTAGAGPVTSRGLLLSAGRTEWALAWAKRGLAPLVVAAVEGWTLVVPAGAPMARPPYDDPVRTLAGRPVGMGMRPAIGLFQVGRQAVVTVHDGRWRAVHRWAIWTRHDALVDTPDLTPARTADMVAVAGSVGGAQLVGAEPALRQIWHDGSLQPAQVVEATFRLLGLPGHDVLTGERRGADLPGARTIHPHPRHARAFDRLLEEQARDREDQESR